MTPTPPPTQDDLAAGPKLNILVATKVLRWQARRFRTDDGTPGVHFYTPDGVYWGYELPNFSADISAAWAVVERLASMGAAVQVNVVGGIYACWVIRDGESMNRLPFRLVPTLRREADTAPLAICRAALAAVSA